MSWPLPAALVGVVFLCGPCWLCKGASKDVIAHVQCQVCEIAVQEARSHARNNSITDEDGLSDLVDGLCSLKRKEGRWLLRLDITSEALEAASGPSIVSRVASWLGFPPGSVDLVASWLGFSGGAGPAKEAREHENVTLAVVRRGQAGECRSECMTLHKACKQVLKGKEEALASLLAQSKGVASMREKTCRKACERRRGLRPLRRWADEAFVPKDEQDFELEDMMAKMRAETGMGMQMYKREDMLKMSEGDMETMAAREAYAQEQQAARAGQDL